jgi:SAM-dependent methyltransferase
MSIAFCTERAKRYAIAVTLAPRARGAEIEKLAAILHHLGATDCRRIVDLGAGQGFATVALLDYLAPGGVVFGVDNSPHMVQWIPRHHNIRPTIAPLDKLDIEAGTVDLAVSLATFHHVTHKTLVMREVNRVLRAGRYFVVVDVHQGTPTQQFFDHVVREHCASEHDLDFLDHSWVQLIAQRAGMEHVSSTVENTDWRFQDENTMLQYVRDLLSLELETSQLKPLVDKWLSPHTAADDRSFVLPWSLGFHTLRKAA